MARPLRILVPGLSYHIHARGNGRMTILVDDDDAEKLLELIADVAKRYRVDCHAYCLMRNHYHAVATTNDANLSAAMHALDGAYAEWWNDRHAHVGHVFQGRFGAKVVQNDVYLLTVCRYVLRNPVRKALVETPDQWPWSSYRASAGLDPVPAFLRPEILWQLLSDGDQRTQIQCFRDFVDQPADDSGVVNQGPVIGDEMFIRSFEPFRRRASREVPRREREVSSTLDILFAGAVTRAAREARVLAAHQTGHARTAIARFLGVHVSTIDRIIERESRRCLGAGAGLTPDEQKDAMVLDLAPGTAEKSSGLRPDPRGAEKSSGFRPDPG